MGFIGKTNSSQVNKVMPFSMANSLPVQTKLTVSKASDPAEKEADNVARKVVDDQKDKKTAAKTGDEKTDNATPMPISESTPDTKNEGIKTKEDQVRKNIGKKEEPKKEVQKKSEQKEEKKVAKKEAADDKKDRVVAKDDKKQEVHKKSEQKEEKKAGKKANGKEENNQDKKPVDKEKELNARPKPINLKDSTGKEEKPVIHQKPEEKTPVNALGRKEGDKGPQPEQQNDEVADEPKLQALEEKINARRGKGKQLNNQVKAEMEQSFSHDFSEVKIHDDKESAELCASLNAQAFAIGNDIFFNTGKYDPESNQGKELLAHELTHVVQQKEQVQRALVSRNPKPSVTTSGINDTSNTITIDKLKMPKLKNRNKGKIDGSIKRPKNYVRDTGLAQDEKWKEDVQPKIAAIIEKKIKGVPVDPDTNVYYLGYKKIKLFGSKEKLIENTRIPLWNKAGDANAFDVDHIKEMQLGGKNVPKENMELLNFSANRSSGSIIKNGIRDSIEEFLKEEKKKTPTKKLPSVDVALKKYDIIFNKADYTLNVAGNGDDYWSYDEITDGEHLEKFKRLTVKEIDEVKGSPTKFIVYTSEAGGKGLREEDFKAMPGLNITGFDFKNPNSDIAGTITGKILPNSKIIKPYNLVLKIYKTPGVLFGGYIKRRVSGEGSLEKILSRMEIEGLSPVEFQSADLVAGKGFYAKGKINSTVKFIEKLDVDITLEGDNIEISRTFSSGEITSVPPPFKINDASVTIFAGTAGIGLRGAVDFEITNVGKGQVKGSGKSNGIFELEGKFEFDKKIFDRADVGMNYRHESGKDDKWEVNGNIQIPKGKIKGIKKAGIAVSYDGTTLKANGDADFDIPGIEHGKLDVTYTREQMIIEGEVDIKNKLIKSGKINAKVVKTGDDYNVSLSGKAKPNIPGVETDLSVDYIDGILTISGTVAYNKGRLSGSVTVGVTNQSVGADGKPSGTGGKSLTAFGGGSLTLKITDWLQGTAGIMLKPDGSIEVVGKIGIPAAVDIFPKKEIKKEIFKAPTIEIPLFAIPVGSHSIGLVATIGGGADAYASIGPGQLTEAAVEVTYNPSHEEDMKISGNAKFRVPAEAGLRLYVRAGIGLSIGIARVAGGIELGGALGIEGAAEAGVQVNWSPTQGFKLDAEASVYVQPKFKFDVNAYIEAVLDLWVTEFSKEWKWNLYAFEYGPALRFGVKFPVHYEENKPFDISLNDVQFETPEINVGEFAKGIGKQLVG